VLCVELELVSILCIGKILVDRLSVDCHHDRTDGYFKYFSCCIKSSLFPVAWKTKGESQV